MQLSFATSPKTLSWMEHNLRTDERVVRYIVVKNRKLAKLPNQHQLQQLADKRCVAWPRAKRLGRLPATGPALAAGAAARALAPPVAAQPRRPWWADVAPAACGSLLASPTLERCARTLNCPRLASQP